MAVQRKPQLKAEIENITTPKRELRKNPEQLSNDRTGLKQLCQRARTGNRQACFDFKFIFIKK